MMPMVNISVTTLYMRRVIPTVLFAAAAGTTDRGPCVRLIATEESGIAGGTGITGTAELGITGGTAELGIAKPTLWVSASPGHRNNLIFLCYLLSISSVFFFI